MALIRIYDLSRLNICPANYEMFAEFKTLRQIIVYGLWIIRGQISREKYYREIGFVYIASQFIIDIPPEISIA